MGSFVCSCVLGMLDIPNATTMALSTGDDSCRTALHSVGQQALRSTYPRTSRSGRRKIAVKTGTITWSHAWEEVRASRNESLPPAPIEEIRPGPAPAHACRFVSTLFDGSHFCADEKVHVSCGAAVLTSTPILSTINPRGQLTRPTLDCNFNLMICLQPPLSIASKKAC